MKNALPLIFLILSSCASSVTMPPSISELVEIKELLKKGDEVRLNRLSEEERQAFTFFQAQSFLQKNKRKHACDHFKYLAKDKKFPLKELSFVYSLKACDYNELTLLSIWNEEKKVPSYLEEFYYEASYDLATKHQKWVKAAEFASKLTKYKRIRKEKEELFLKALAFANDSGDREVVQNIQNQYHELSPRFIKNPSKEKLYKVGRDFERDRNFLKARKIYRKIINDKKRSWEERTKAYNRYAMTYKLQRMKPEYANQIGALAKWVLKESKKDSLYKDLLEDKYGVYQVRYARALWTVNKTTQAKKVIENYIKNGPHTDNNLSSAFWVLSAMDVEAKRYNQAISYLKKALDLKNLDDKKLKEKIVWAYGWNHYLLKNYEKAAIHYLKEAEITESIFIKQKYIFWAAKALRNKGDKSEAEDLFKDLAEKYPFDYYGIVSHMELSESLDPVELNPLELDYEDPTLHWLIALNETKLSENYIKGIQKNYKELDDVEEFLPVYYHAGWHEGGIFKFFRLSPEERNEILDDYAQIAFPIPYQKEIKQAHKRFDIPEELIYSISRQESAFNPTIRSWADAFGLMQILPEKAKRLSRKLNLEYKTFTDLYDASLNVQMGSKLLSDLKKKFNGNFIGYVASYNAGVSPVRRWFKERGRKDPIEFIEMIPYEETQGYVKLVFRNFVTYSRLLGKEVTPKKSFFETSAL